MARGFYRSEEGKDLPDILIRLWIDDTPAKLDEVLIEGKRCAYAKSLHKDKAGAVDKAEPFVQRDGFMDDHVAGDKESLIGLNKANSETMKPVGLISEGKERGRVNED